MIDQTDSAKTSSLDSLVATRAPVSQFVPLFENRREAVKYFANIHASLNDRQAVKGPCVVCSGEPASGVAVYRWCATFFSGVGFGPLEVLLLFVGRIGVTVKTEVVTFDTFHPICAACVRRMRRRRWLANVLNFFGLFLAIVAGTATAIGWSGVIYFDRPSERKEWVVLALGASAAFALGLACLWPLKKLRIPASIRYLAHRPIFYHSAEMVAGADSR
jgi:hypothetical protein